LTEVAFDVYCMLTLMQVLSAQQLVLMAMQIARGLQQLHRRRLLHRDVAARNCM